MSAGMAMGDSLMPMDDGLDDDEQRKRMMLPGAAPGAVPPALAAPALTGGALPEVNDNSALALQQNPALALAPNQAVVDQAENGTAHLEFGQDGSEANVKDASLKEGQVVPVEGPQLPAQPAAVPGGQLTPEQLAAAATAPNPQGDEVDKVLAANPIAAPRPALPPGPVDVQGERKKILEEQGDLTDAAVGAEQRVGTARAAQANAEANIADQVARMKAQEAAEQEKIIKEANGKTQAWADRAAAENQKYQQMGLHDYWADKSTGNKVLAGLSIMFGAAGRTSNADNPGMKIINDAVERDYRLQMARIEKQKSNAGMAKDQYEMGLSSKQHALADLNLKTAAGYEQLAAQGVAMKLRQGATIEQAQSDVKIAALRQEAVKLRSETLDAVHKNNIDDARLAIEQQRADQAGLVAAARAKKLKGGGGAGRSSAMEDFVTAAGALKPGEGIPPQVAALGLRAGLKPNQVAAEVDKYRNSGAKADKMGLAGDRQLSKEASEWGKQNGLTALTKKQDELSAVLEEVKNAPHNPLQQALAVEKAVSSARGGAASRQALDLALHHLGGKWDSIESMIQGAKSGELGQKQMDNFIGFMNNQLGTAQAEGKKKYDAYGKYLDSQPEEKKTQLLAERGKLFSGLAGFGGAAPARAAAPQRKLTSTEAAKLIQFVNASPSDPRVAAAKTKLRDSGYQGY